jgi:hypothetical protein
MREMEFYQNILIEETDKPRAAKALKSKGIEKHILIKDYLMTWRRGEVEKKIRYSEIASIYRYDKRIRNVLFKYISYIEELYRGILLDSFTGATEQTFWRKSVKTLLDEHTNLNNALEDLPFSELLWQTQAKGFPAEVKSLCPFPDTHLCENTKALIELRNAVMHNKFLILYRGFEICYVSGVDAGKSASLKANIYNLHNFLPNEVGDKMLVDINDCRKKHNNDNKTKWDLPTQIIVKV